MGIGRARGNSSVKGLCVFVLLLCGGFAAPVCATGTPYASTQAWRMADPGGANPALGTPVGSVAAGLAEAVAIYPTLPWASVQVTPTLFSIRTDGIEVYTATFVSGSCPGTDVLSSDQMTCTPADTVVAGVDYAVFAEYFFAVFSLTMMLFWWTWAGKQFLDTVKKV